MFCHVCSKEIACPKYETIGKQVVCCLSCVGLLISNEEDKCDQCQRPVWKDNYYIFHSKNYCSEKCKITAVKRYLKQNTSLSGVNIKHIQNEYFRNDSPIKNLQELRKEVKELYNDFEFEDNCSSKKIPELSENKTINTIYSDKSQKQNQEVNESINNNSNIKNNIEPEYNNNNINNNLADESFNKLKLIPNRIESLKIGNNDNNIIKYKESFNGPRLLSKKKILKSYRRQKNNYSFDNKDRMIYDTNDMDNIPKLKYSCYKSKHSINNINNSFKNMKLNPSVLRYQNRDQKMKNKIIIRIPDPHMLKINGRNNSKYNEPFINNENENYENIDYRNRNHFSGKYKQYNTVYNDTNLNKDDEVKERRLVYLCEPKYKLTKIDNF